MTIIRAYELKKGDVFRMFGTAYFVRRVYHGVITYGTVGQNNHYRHSLSANSQERVELISTGPFKSD